MNTSYDDGNETFLDKRNWRLLIEWLKEDNIMSACIFILQPITLNKKPSLSFYYTVSE